MGAIIETIIATTMNLLFIRKMDDVHKASPAAFWSILALCIGLTFFIVWRVSTRY
jgi:hypothetical protein